MKSKKILLLILLPFFLLSCQPQHQPQSEPEPEQPVQKEEPANQNEEKSEPEKETPESPQQETKENQNNQTSVENPSEQENPETEEENDEEKNEDESKNSVSEPEPEPEEIFIETVTFSTEGNIEYETELILSCQTQNAKIFYSYSEFLQTDYSKQKEYLNPLIITANCKIYAVAVLNNQTSQITNKEFSITNLEELIYGEAEVYTDSQKELLSVASNEKSVSTNNLGLILGEKAQVIITKNDATQPENWNDSWRLYYTSREGKNSNTMEIISEEYKIKKIILESNNSTAGKFQCDVGNFDPAKKIWTGSENRILFTPTENARLTKILLVFETCLN